MEKPKRIYKYQPISQYSLRNLKNNQIYFNDPKNFNDPFDTFQEVRVKPLSEDVMKSMYLKFGIDRIAFGQLEKGIASEDLCEKVFINFSKNLKWFSANLRKELKLSDSTIESNSFSFFKNTVYDQTFLQKAICKTFYTSFNDVVASSMDIIREGTELKTGISCFSEKNDDLLMWSHYADSHKGFCLEFDCNREPFTKMYPVQYSKEIPVVDPEKVLINTDNNIEIIERLLLSKYIDWQYEKEWRIIHREVKTSFRYETDALTGIYFGNRINSTDLEIIITIIKSYHPMCRFYMMEKVKGEFKLKPLEINYFTFIEIKSEIQNKIKKYIVNGEIDIDLLMNDLDFKISRQQLKSVLGLIESEKKGEMIKG